MLTLILKTMNIILNQPELVSACISLFISARFFLSNGFPERGIVSPLSYLMQILSD